MSKKLAIILVNWNSYELTNDTLQSLYQTSYQDYDIICVDNASTDDSLSQIKTNHAGIIILTCDQNTGFTGGNNKGMQYALAHGYAYTLLLNNDVAVESDFLEPLVQALDANENLGAVQPLIYFHHDRTLIWNAGSRYNKWLGVTKTIGYNKKDADHTYRYQNQGDENSFAPEVSPESHLSRSKSSSSVIRIGLEDGTSMAIGCASALGQCTQ